MSTIRPSSLPALAECPCFESGSSDFAEAGTRRHAALAELFKGNEAPLALLDDGEEEGVRWALEQIKLTAPMRDHQIAFEEKGICLTDGFESILGTRDVVCGPNIWDLKWRYRDYTPQMAAYALMTIQEFTGERYGEVTVYILFAEQQRVEKFKLTESAALAIIEPIIAGAKNPDRVPTPCEYCSMCELKLTCSARNERAQAVAKGREDWKLEQYNASRITKPEEMAKALALAEELSSWCDAVKHFAVEMWTKQGLIIPGCKLKENKGREYYTNLQAAFEASNMLLETFLKCCTVRKSSSKTNPNLIGLFDSYVQANKGIKTIKATKAELAKKLEPFTARGKSSYTVVTDRNQATEEETENA